MKLPVELQSALDAAKAAPATEEAARRAVGLLDLTSLNDDDDEASVRDLCRRAVTPVGPVAAVCVWPRFVAEARRALEGRGVRVATVVNFPRGDGDLASVVAETRAAVAAEADEIDMVLPYRAFIEGARTQPLAIVRACREACGEGVVLKVILETGAFPGADLLAWAARDSINAGADFLKTSTGRTQPAATLPCAALLLHAVHESSRPVGVKVAGGIRDAATAIAYLNLAGAVMGPDWATPQTFRYGASGLLDSLLGRLGEASVAGQVATGY